MPTVRPPRPGSPTDGRHRDPLTSPVDALDVIGEIAARPPTAEIICVHLDAHRRVVGAFAVTGITDPGHVVEVAAVALDAATGATEPGGLLLASVRPDSSGPDPHDAARWDVLDTLCAEAGVELVEWLVVTPRAVTLPRVAAQAADRWSSHAAPPG